MKEIKIKYNTSIAVRHTPSPKSRILFYGMLNGLWGDIKIGDNGYIFGNNGTWNNGNNDILFTNFEFLVSAVKQKCKITIIGDDNTIKYFDMLYNVLFYNFGMDGKNKQYPRPNFIKWYIGQNDDHNSFGILKSNGKYEHIYNRDELFNVLTKNGTMKFDTIIQNPPYKKTMHLDFLEKGLDVLEDNGTMIIIEPSSWLINIRKNTKNANRYDNIKNRIGKHIKSVVIENYNECFGTSSLTPFSVTTIDMNNTYDDIEFKCFGDKKIVKSIYDCNLIGKYETIWSILNKVNKYGDMMKDHIWDYKKSGGFYLTYMDICASVSSIYSRSNTKPESDGWFESHKLGDFFQSYISVSCHPKFEITNYPQHAFKACGNSVTNKIYSEKFSAQLYGTKLELENWRHFIYNNKLPLFINIVMTIDQHCNSFPFLPWLTDSIYTDEEIANKFGFTDEEMLLIDHTIKKYERNSPWFRRYMCGEGENTEKTNDKEIDNFIKSIN